LDAVVEKGQEVVGDDTFDGFAIAVTQADPEAVELGAAEEGFADGHEVVGKITDKIDGTDSVEWNFLMLAVLREQVDGVGLAEARRIEIAAKGLFVGEDKNDFLVSRGWGSVFQRNQYARVGKGRNLRLIKEYVMLSAFFLSTYCFH